MSDALNGLVICMLPPQLCFSTRATGVFVWVLTSLALRGLATFFLNSMSNAAHEMYDETHCAWDLRARAG